MRRPYSLSDFDYALPDELIAQRPSGQRSASRLLHVSANALADRSFTDLPWLVEPGDVVVLNDTRVMRARVFGTKTSGGRVEMLIERIVSREEAWAQLKASHLPKPGSTIALTASASAEVLERDERMFKLRFNGVTSLDAWLEQHGEVPLPPYIARPASDEDANRYQTVFARETGAVAAPTAGLHFDEALLQALRERGVTTTFLTLHVGAGTFQPVTDEDLSKHRMHSESYVISDDVAAAIGAARERGGRVVAVGTTTLRALESAATGAGNVRSGADETALFIVPGFRFRVVDRLLTNFHLPRSTLLMLVSAFAGFDRIRNAYAHAVRQRYRFFSYGDAMLLDRAAAT
ncbi:MAG TPA: tRNA preQ1(34) S-adenosylmethionine ribosyltransferase-isomerase QueA [Casimicrobiaceae bacterium]|nr:tRNA preQ1(34) S-adenosylmethionine ribosyltransferase-isomerase QueA [Casimicrobiaceae bacterium]